MYARTVEKGKSLFKERLSGVRVLLILDDVDEMKQSHALVGDWLALGSRVIITSRDKHILHHAGVSSDEFIHEMSGLQMNEGLQLFSWHAFLRSSPFPSHKNLSERIVEACKGHPLSLEVIGSFLYDKQNDSDCWTEALHNITHHPDIRERFKISYNALSEEEKEIFLDIACFFVGENKTYPIVFWKSLYRMVQTAISTLSLKLLIKIDDDGVFDMHDHLQDMGRSIAEREREGSRLWDSAHLSGGVSNDNNLSRLRLNGGNSQGLETLYAPALQFLHLEDVPIAGITRAMLPPSLIWLRLQNCGKPFHTSLHVRNIWLSAIQWPSCFSFVDNIWYLRVLQIDWDIPNLQCSLSKILGNLSQLQHLDLRDCSKLNKLPRTIGKLSNLQRLDLSNCQKLKKLPHTIGRLSNLQSLKLQCCDKLNELPHTIGNLSQLHHLDLMRCNLNNLPDALCNLSKLQQLRLKEFKNLNLPHTIDNLVQLQHLKLFLCGNLNSLPNTIGNLSQLQHLCLKSCINLNNLPHTIGNLLQLQHLNLEECVSLNNLPDTICNLTQLQGLYSRGCKNLNKLPHNIGSLVNLQRLNLTRCVNLKDLPNTIGNLVQLQQLNLRECEHLKNLPDTIGSLLNLQKFDLNWCVQLNELPCTVGNLSQLQYLNLEGCRNLSNLPDTIGNLSQLQYFNLRGCRNLNSLPDTIGNLSQLQQLNLKGCRNLSKLPDTIKNLSQLQHLNLK